MVLRSMAGVAMGSKLRSLALGTSQPLQVQPYSSGATEEQGVGLGAPQAREIADTGVGC